MSRASDKAKEHRNRMLRFLEDLDESKIEELYQRGRFPASPLRAQQVGASKGEHSDPTASEVVGHYDEEGNWHDTPDPAGRSMDEIFAGLAEAAGVLLGENGVERKVQYVQAVPIDREARAKELPGAGDCQCCGFFCSGARNDRIESGYCHKCFVAWGRAGRPDRGEFERARRKHLSEREDAA